MLESSEVTVPDLRWSHTFRALRHRNFRLYWLGQIVSLIGTWMQVVALGWLVYRITDSPLMLGLVSVVGLVPVIPLSLLAGIISDWLPRRKIIIITELVLAFQAFILAGLTWLELVKPWHVVLLSFVVGAATALEQPARLAFVVETVGKEDLSNAVALNASVYNAGRILGPAIAGIMVAWTGEAGCFFINAISYLVVVLCLLAIRLPPQVVPPERPKMAGNFIKGLQYIWEIKNIRLLMTIVGLASFLILPYLALMPVFARDVFQVGPKGLGFLMTAVGIGAIIGTLFVASLQSGHRGKWLTVGNILSPAFLLLFCLSSSFTLSLGLALLLGISNAIRQTLANSLIQITASEEYLGRVMSVFHLLFAGMSQLGALAFGAGAELVSVPVVVGIGAVINLVFGLIFITSVPEIYSLK